MASVLFENEDMRAQYSRLQSDLWTLTEGLAVFSEEERLPPPFLTEVHRNKPRQVLIYLEYWPKLIAQHKAGKKLSTKETADAIRFSKMTQEQLRAAAEERFTWHYCLCAIDLRTVGPNPKKPHYTEEQKRKVIAWLQKRCPTGQWLVLPHDVHGPHIHVERRDWELYRRFINGTLSTL